MTTDEPCPIYSEETSGITETIGHPHSARRSPTEDWIRSTTGAVAEMPAAQAMSAMLFRCREHLSMWSDVVISQTGKVDPSLVALIAEVDGYRATQGWSPHGFGGETGA